MRCVYCLTSKCICPKIRHFTTMFLHDELLDPEPQTLSVLFRLTLSCTKPQMPIGFEMVTTSTPIWAASQSKQCWFVPLHLFHSFPSSKHCRESFQVTFALFSLFFSFWISLYITQIYSNILPVSPMRVFAPPVGAHCFASWSCFIWAKESTGDLVGRRRGILWYPCNILEQFGTSWNSGEASQNRSESIDVCPLSGSVSTHLLACVLCSACFFALRVFVCVCGTSLFMGGFGKLCLWRLFIPVHVFSTLHRAVCGCVRERERQRDCGGRFCWVIQSELSSSVQKKHDVRTLPNCCIVGFSVSLNYIYILRFLPQACCVSLLALGSVSNAKAFNLRFSSSRNYSTALGMH